MQCLIHDTAGAPPQTLDTEWHGAAVQPPFYFRFHTAGGRLVFEAWRDAAAQLHPKAQEGCFQENLWKYDVVEFFVATPDARRYLEFNLSPNGAWWAAAFTEPRVPLHGFCGSDLAAAAHGHISGQGWRCRAEINLNTLEARGWLLPTCRLAVCAVLSREGQYTYLTTCEQRDGKPDFHHPWDWERALSTAQ